MVTKEEAVQLLRDMIQINTENDNEEELARYIQEFLSAHGIESELVEFAPRRASLVAEISNGPGKKLGLTGHLDVVSAGNAEDWTHSPFSGFVDENKILWGRGASDMKSGLAALVLAMVALHESQDYSGTIRLLATVGEEVGEYGSKQLTKLGYVDDLDGMLIGEPCNIGIIYAHKGSLNYKVTSKGTAAHSSMPELGNNAIEHLNHAMLKISEAIAQEATKHTDPELGQTFHNITVVTGGQQVNSIPDWASFEANARTIPAFDNQDVIRTVKEVIEELNEQEGFDLSIEVTADQKPVVSDKHSPLIQSILKVQQQFPSLQVPAQLKQMEEVLGGDLSGQNDLPSSLLPLAVSGTTDAAQFTQSKKTFDVAVYGPGIPMLNHKIDERLPVDQYWDFIAIYQAILSDYLS
ncbi:ArgE/DapE family deacylase [Streptococcus suis]|nr:ArgE/DapE family deacylase [Streptococcus suis]NJW38249.1 ArgE/DapE family deacylase [Streptococcus suis]NQI72392.1 ArgE/DapE family deacylase [Streptococcus suis]NQM13723.1 ArgE/DapE family deacylase [Streptococcus suis]HEM3560806.1 ArgE/DapE family deacylase [Streptococcus suis]